MPSVPWHRRLLVEFCESQWRGQDRIIPRSSAFSLPSSHSLHRGGRDIISEIEETRKQEEILALIKLLEKMEWVCYLDVFSCHSKWAMWYLHLWIYTYVHIAHFTSRISFLFYLSWSIVLADNVFRIRVSDLIVWRKLATTTRASFSLRRRTILIDDFPGWVSSLSIHDSTYLQYYVSIHFHVSTCNHYVYYVKGVIEAKPARIQLMLGPVVLTSINLPNKPNRIQFCNTFGRQLVGFEVFSLGRYPGPKRQIFIIILWYATVPMLTLIQF